MLKAIMIRSALLALAFGMSLTAHAYASDPKRFDVPPGDLAAALQALAKQSGVELVYQSKQLEGLRTKGLKGSFTPEDAVTKLLEGTPLIFRKDPSGAMLIAPPRLNPLSSVEEREGPAEREDEGNNPPPGTGEDRGEGRMRWWQRLAQANPSPGTGEGGTAERGMRSGESSDTNSQELPAPEETGKAIPEILVRGSKSLNSDIKRTRDDSQPYVVFERQAIERSGEKNIEDFIKSRLTSANSAQTPSQSVRGGNISSIDLRGLGSGQTLILVDGRRVAPFNSGGSAIQPDLNGIPTSAVERIEVLPSTGSGIYGGGATGGVINIVLRRDYNGLEAKLTHEGTFDGGGRRDSVSIGAGTSLNGGKTSLFFFGSYLDGGKLVVGDRDLAERSRSLTFQNNAAALLASPTPPLGRTTNIRSSTGGNLSLKPALGGTALNSPVVSVPYGYAGPASDGAVALVARAGQYNLDLADTAQRGGRGETLLNEPTTKSASLTLRQELSPRIRAFLEVSASDNDGEAISNGQGGTFVVPASAQSNPFAQTVRVTTPAIGADQVVSTTMRNRRAVAGLVATLGKGWEAAFDYTWNRNRYFSSFPSSLTAPSAGTDVNAGTLNVFRDTSAFATDFSPYRFEPNTFGPVNSSLKDASIRFAGPTPLALPGGPIAVTASLSHRREALDDFFQTSQFFDPAQNAPADFVSQVYDRSLSVSSIYLETKLPILSPTNHVPGIELLELQLAGRYDEYRTDSANSTSSSFPEPVERAKHTLTSEDPTIALRFRPVRDITLRASYGTGFLPPDLAYLIPSNSTTFLSSELVDIGLTDPRRGDEIIGGGGDVEVLGGGNPSLRPEQSQSRSFGFILTPRIVPNLRISADWTKIEKHDNVAGFTLQQSNIDRELVIPSLIERGAPSGGFAVGPIIAYRTQPVNVARQTVEALDFSVDYRLQTMSAGEFALSAAATRSLHNQTQVLVTLPVNEFTGTANNLPWRGNATLSWQRAGLSAQWTVRYYDSYFLNLAHTVVASQGSATIPSQTYHDLLLSYRFGPNDGPALLSNSEIQLGTKNLFNQRPPTVTGSVIPYSAWGDPRLGTYWLAINKSFGR